MRSSLNLIATIAFFWLTALPGSALAQSDAEIALQKARTAFFNEQFETARDLLETASQTDSDNPDVFLLLGRTHYQLGQVDQAIAAWQRTLALAPAHAYAKRMVDTLRGKILDTDLRIEIARSLLLEQLPLLTLADISAIKRESLSNAQLVQLLALEAEALLETGQASAALKPLRELAIRDPAQAATAHVRLLLGKAKLSMHSESVVEGLQILTEVRADFADTAEGVAADLALISFRIDQGEDALDELIAWIAANRQQPGIHAAQQTMIRAVSVFLTAAESQPTPSKDQALSDTDLTALEAAEQALASLKRAEDSLQLSRQVIAHIQNRFIARGSYTAANAAIGRLLNVNLPKPSRALFDQALLSSKNAAASEELDKILSLLQVGDGSPDLLADWIESNGNHMRLVEARTKLVSAYLDRTRRQGIPRGGPELTESDKLAFAAAASVLRSMPSVNEKLPLIQGLLNHLKVHYVAAGAHQAAISGQQTLLKLQLPRPIRRSVLSDLADTQSERTMLRLESEVAAGTLKPGPLGPDLLALLETLATINQEFPDQPSWSKQAAIGGQLAALSPRVPWPAIVTQIKSTDDWALEFVLPVIVADRDANASEAATTVLSSIVDSAAAMTQSSARGLASKVQQRLLNALPADHETRPRAVLRQLSLLIADDSALFQENTAQGRSQRNAVLSDTQKDILALAAQLISDQPNMATDVLSALQPFLLLRDEAGYDAIVQESYGLLEDALPPAPLRKVRLAVAQSWIDEVIASHARLLGNGFMPPKELDEKMQRALVRCYQLQSELEPDHAFVADVQNLRSTVITHYRNLQYFETAEAAMEVKADPAVDWIDAAAQFERVSLRLSIAMDELAGQTRQFEGLQNMTLTPGIKEAIAGLETFVTERPTDPLVGQAVSKILLVGKTYEQYEKYDIAAEIYTALETFADANETLQHAKPLTATIAQQAAIAVAYAIHVKASKALAKTIDGQPAGSEPPTELSEEFAAAMTAYQTVLTKYPDSPLVSSAIGKMMEIALQHASVGSWDVAEGVYAELQALELPLRQPERLDLARALCEMGKVMPEHARQMLAVITLWERETQSATGAISQIAGFAAPEMEMMGDVFGGGIGGAGMLGAAETNEGFRMGLNRSPAVPQGAAAMAESAVPMAESMDEGAIVGDFAVDSSRAARESNLLAAVRQQQAAMASQVAMMRDTEIQHVDRLVQQQQNSQQEQQPAQQVSQQASALPVAVLSEAEIARRQEILDGAYTKLQAIRQAHADSTTAGQAREQIMVIVNHWRSIRQWQRAAALVKQFLTDNANDIELPQLRHGIARDYLAWAAAAVKPGQPKQELLDEVNKRFTQAREELSGIIAAFEDNQDLVHQAQWDIANSHLSQARVVARFSATLARGQFVRAANELLETSDLYHDHPKIHEIPQMLWNISQELTSRRFYDEAITVWNEMTLHYPGDPLAEQAALQIAQTYQNRLSLPLRAVESYLELNFARGGNDAALQDSIFQIASQLMSEKRWVESLHVLETFVDSFPSHASAGQALTMIGQVHQTNEVWEDAIAAYRRVILEYDQGNWALQSKWSIAECTINLSRWEEAQGAYREFERAYPEDPKVAEATLRLETLKDLARFQKVVDEPGQRKAFDAQFQIAAIVGSKLANPIKAIIEYRKVAERWPESHLADDALFQVGMIYMELSRTESAREAFLATAEKYPTSPLADDALFQVGASFESEAQALAGVTRGQAIEIANDIAQKQAYTLSQDNRRQQRVKNLGQIAQLKKAGKREEADKQTAFQAASNVAFDQANALVVANWAAQQEVALTTAQLADRQDKTNASLRKAVASFRRAASVASADKADDALLRMAQIYDQRLKDSDAAMATWLEIVKQYSGTTVAEDASWKIAKYYETNEKYGDAIAAYNSFLRNYRRSPKASEAQAAIAENHEQLGNWVEAMDAYTNYINNFPEGTLASKAKEQIAWIKTYRL